MPIDLAQVDWVYVGVLAILAFLASMVGNILAFNNRGSAALLTALVFAVLFIAWTYYPHHLPLPTRLYDSRAAVTAPAAAPAVATTPARPTPPKNPVTDITPPKNPVTDITPPAR
ncbi:MAG: hypothetical protein GC182_22565 [Rhodopseudomonas sp.]|nr:hypothetical protein [Rhodopseudomonas sp.]